MIGSLLTLVAPGATAATRHPVMGCTKAATASDCGEAGPAYTRLKVSWRGFREQGYPAEIAGSDVFDLLAEVSC